MKYIFGLLPFSKTSKVGQLTPWSLVLFGKWFNTNRLFNPKWETSLSYLPEEQCFAFTSYWLPPNTTEDDSDKYFFKLWRAPWLRINYKFEELKGNFKTTFNIFEKGKRIPVKATVTGIKSYSSYYGLPNFLKFLGKRVKTEIKIDLSTDIGKDRGTWKGGTTSLYYPFTKDLATSWLNFEYYELPKYVKKEK